MIPIRIEKDKATAQGPFSMEFYALIAVLAGRKHWPPGRKMVAFDASRSNIKKLNESGFEIKWSCANNELAELEALEKMPTQHEAVKIDLSKYDYHPAVEPYKHQFKALALSLFRQVYALFLEMGLGKTFIIIVTAAILFMQKKVSGVLVLAPKGVHASWINEEIPKHIDPKIPWYGIIWKGNPIKSTLFRRKGKLTFFTMNVDAVRTAKGFKAAMEFLSIHNGTSMMVIDESHLIKTASSERTKACFVLGAKAAYKRILTGTPIAKNLVDAWSQFKFLDIRILGHNSMVNFRSRYCIMGGFEGREIVGHRNVEEFYRLIAPHTFRMTKAEALDLPPKIYVTRNYEMSDETRKHHKMIKDALMTALDDGTIVDVPNAAVALVRMQQVLCGFLPDGEGNLQTISDERINVLLEITRQVSGKVIIWARFREDIRRIQAALEKEEGKGSVVTYTGGTNTKDREEAINKFRDKKSKVRHFVSTSAGSTGTNLQVARSVIYYSNSFNALHRWQSEDRPHRMGMEGSCTYFDIVAYRSVDVTLVKNIKKKKSISDLTLDEIRRAIIEMDA